MIGYEFRDVGYGGVVAVYEFDYYHVALGCVKEALCFGEGDVDAVV